MNNKSQNSGFTLVELMVSVGITAILMMGVATFFSSTFKNMFEAREQVTSTQENFVVNTILGGKFVNVVKLEELGPSQEYAVLQNDMNTGDLPFTYIGLEKDANNDDHIVFKDFFVFNGRENDWLSQSAPNLSNPAGLTVIPPYTYVAVPLENKIYRCDESLSTCPVGDVLDIPGLKAPIDITGNGSNTIYVTDAGNNRILKITDLGLPKPTVTPIAADELFNYPTGIDFYSDETGDNLFVADTYNHLVKKINISSGTVTVVAGDGDDEDCDPSDGRQHSTIYCKLSFPTGVIADNFMGFDELYISDTGNERVLRVRDPESLSEPNLYDYEIIANVSGSPEVNYVDFVFPDNVTINSIQEGTSGNPFHKARYEIDNNIVRLHLSAPMTKKYTELENVCSGIPEVCVPTRFLRGFDVASEDNIFVINDNISIEGHDYHVTDVSPTRILILPEDTQYYPDNGTEVRITDSVTGGEVSFYLDVTDIDFDSNFNLITTEVYEPGDVLNNDPADFQTLRVGDGILGTEEDVIDVIGGGSFPTGIGKSIDSTPEYYPDPVYDTDFTDVGYDYTSEFIVDESSFGFSEPNPDSVLEMEFDAKLGEDDEGGITWEENTLNAKIK